MEHDQKSVDQNPCLNSRRIPKARAGEKELPRSETNLSNPASVSRHVERGSSEIRLAARVSMETRCCKALILRSVKSPSIRKRRLTHQERSISPHVAAKKECGAIRHQLVLRNQMAITSTYGNKFFGLGGTEDFRAFPTRPIPIPGRA